MSAALAVGVDVPGPVVPLVGQEAVNAYLVAAGDDNPLHREPEIARQFGLEGVPVPGMLVMAQLARCAANWPHFGGVLRLSARFVRPVLIGADLAVGGRVVAIEPAAGEAVIRVTAKQAGKITVLGEVKVRLR